MVPTTLGLTGSGEPEQITAAAGSGTLFRVLRVDAARGRLFGPDDGRAEGLGHGEERVAAGHGR